MEEEQYGKDFDKLKDYLSVSYDESEVPLTTYPEKLAGYLFKTFKLQPNEKMLEIASGRCEVAIGFKKLGLDVTCIDSSPESKKYADKHGIDFILEQVVASTELSVSNCSFDIIFTKSFVEHFDNPFYLFKEFHRILKPKGKLIILTPDFEKNFKIFYDDITHIKPYTKESMKQILDLYYFGNLKVFTFRQLPITWKFKLVDSFCKLIALMIPVRTKYKFLRWSRELMLVGYGEKV